MNKEAQELIEIRDYRPTDFNLIKETMIPQIYHGNSYNKNVSYVKGAPIDINGLIDRRVFEEAYAKVVEFIVSRPHTVIKVAADKLDPDTTYGYSIFYSFPNENILHFIYVKKDWRKAGIGKDLMPPNVKTVTHITKTGVSLLNKYKLKYNPFKL